MGAEKLIIAVLETINPILIQLHRFKQLSVPQQIFQSQYLSSSSVKMLLFFSLLLFAISALAQRAQIGLPTEGQEVTAGNDVVVQVQRPVSFNPRCRLPQGQVEFI